MLEDQAMCEDYAMPESESREESDEARLARRERLIQILIEGAWDYDE